MKIEKAKALAKSYRADFRFDFSKRAWVLTVSARKVLYLTPLELEQITPWRFECDYLRADKQKVNN